MTNKTRNEISKISQEFAEPFYEMTGGINNSGWLIVDPLSGYLNSIGHTHVCKQVEPCEKHGLILILEFPDGSIFIPAGGDLKCNNPEAENWMWFI